MNTDFVIGQAYFWICAAVALAGAFMTVIAKNPIRGAMGLLLMVLAVAGLFLALHAQFLAAIQLIVYAGAIVVLFIFVIMILGPSASLPSPTESDDSHASPPPSRGLGLGTRTFGAALFAISSLAAMWFLIRAMPALPASPKERLLADTPADFGSIEKFGSILFGPALVPFELSSALLMVAIVGAVAVARGRTRADLVVRNDKGRTNPQNAAAATGPAATPTSPTSQEAHS
ncbi:MAG: NADH-quinone oxidoreductase subunit J [Polyangiaceae bacterium]|nr:NADH-quinone oxidoreductase subunit J [Polyangiaceae bacterium]